MESTLLITNTIEDSLLERALKAEAEVEFLTEKITYPEAQIRLLAIKRYGSSSEKTNKDQLKLFDSAFNFSGQYSLPFNRG